VAHPTRRRWPRPGGILVAILLVSLTVGAIAAPEALIITRRASMEGDVDPNTPIADFLAEILAEDGRVKPVVWSLTDPIFRTRVDEDRTLGLAEGATPDRVRRAARAFGSDYVIWVQASRKGDRLAGRLELFRGAEGRAFWSDERILSVTNEGATDWDNATASLARTWSQLMAQGPLKGLASRPAPPPETTKPAGETTPTAAPVPRRSEFNPEVLARAQSLARSDQVTEGILLLRDAVDGAPLNVDARKALIEALLAANLLDMAADEARRAATILPEAGRFRLVAARAWLRLNRPEEAQIDLNEALARDAGGPETQVLVGDLRMAQGDAVAARSAYEQALASGPSFDAQFGRGLAAVALGDVETARKDLSTLPAASDTELVNARLRALEALARGFGPVADGLRQVQQGTRRAVRPSDLAVRFANLRRRADALSVLAEFLPQPPPPPGGAPASPGHWALATSLLVQSGAETAALLGGDNEAGADSAITLGEAMRQAEVARGENGLSLAKT